MRVLRTWPQLRGLHGNRWARAYRRLRGAERVAAGLTTRGRPRRLRRWPELHGKSRCEQRRTYERDRRARLAAQGLTSRGTPPIYRRGIPSQLELAWRDLREGMNIRLPVLLLPAAIQIHPTKTNPTK